MHRSIVDLSSEVAAARRSPQEVQIDVGEVGRHEIAVESVLYFTALEALSNATKYAPRPAIELRIADEGSGFDIDEVDRSLGLPSTADRIGAVGGAECRILGRRRHVRPGGRPGRTVGILTGVLTGVDSRPYGWRRAITPTCDVSRCVAGADRCGVCRRR